MNHTGVQSVCNCLQARRRRGCISNTIPTATGISCYPRTYKTLKLLNKNNLSNINLHDRSVVKSLENSLKSQVPKDCSVLTPKQGFAHNLDIFSTIQDRRDKLELRHPAPLPHHVGRILIEPVIATEWFKTVGRAVRLVRYSIHTAI